MRCCSLGGTPCNKSDDVHTHPRPEFTLELMHGLSFDKYWRGNNKMNDSLTEQIENSDISV
jgi:hypothetical protein